MTTVAVRIVNPTLVESTVQFTSPAGVATDPATITVRWRDPAGTITSYVYGTDAEVTRSAAGAYACEYVTTAAGAWIVQWEGADVATGSIGFKVQAAAIIQPAP